MLYFSIVCNANNPLSFNNKIKTLILAKNSAFDSVRKTSGNFELDASIESSKQKYDYRIANKLNDRKITDRYERYF